MTRTDLTEEVSQAVEMPRKESDIIVAAIFDSIVRALLSGDKVEIRGELYFGITNDPLR
jgi:integration host factor subunit beta